MPTNWPIRTPLLSSIALGASFGLFLRIAENTRWFQGSSGSLVGVMTLSYLTLGSAVVGYVTVWCAEITKRRRIWQWIVVPWCAILAVMLAAFVFLFEGAICLVFALPVLMVFSSIGGVAAGLVRRYARPGIATHLCVAVLPLILPQLEMRIPAPLQIRTVSNEIRISAPAAVVWKNIASVNPIRAQELPASWTARIGFPKPIAATLSHDGVGGVRNATFERGVSFVETVTTWAPGRQLAFTIRADTAHIPPDTLDRHVTIGGPYFDVLTGEYQIEEVSPGSVILHLRSRERLTTDFNGYAGLWTDAVMSSIQRSILQVIRQRCESTSQPAR